MMRNPNRSISWQLCMAVLLAGCASSAEQGAVTTSSHVDTVDRRIWFEAAEQGDAALVRTMLEDGVDPLIGTDIHFGVRERLLSRATGGAGSFSYDPPGLAMAAASDRAWAAAEKAGLKEWLESIPEGSDSQRVFEDLAADGNKLIFGTSFGYMEPMLAAAENYPDVVFEHATGFMSSENMGNYFGAAEEGRYLTGMAAGAATSSGLIGYVAAFPIPEVLRGINAFTLGVREINPDAQVEVVWTSTWFDPPKEGTAAPEMPQQSKPGEDRLESAEFFENQDEYDDYDDFCVGQGGRNQAKGKGQNGKNTMYSSKHTRIREARQQQQKR